MKNLLKLIAFFLILTGGVSSCQKNRVCSVNNPLTDLIWLKEIIDAHEENTAWFEAHDETPQHMRIYQCTYKDGDGFLLEPCVGCPDAGYSVRNCAGESVCGGGGVLGHDNCPEFNIKQGKLIYHD